MENTAKEKILGLVLLIAGLSIIGYSLQSGINVFIKTQDPPEIIKNAGVKNESIQTSPKSSIAPLPKNLSEINPQDLQKLDIGSLINPEMMKSIIPPELFGNASRLMNLSIFSIFLWVLIIAGTKVASLGISLIKTNSNIKI